MTIKFLKFDERSVSIVQKIQSVIHCITTLILVLSLFYRNLILDQSIEEFMDIGIVVILNGFFVLSAIFYWGGIPLQRFKLKYILALYFGFVLFMFLLKCFIHIVLQDPPLSLMNIVYKMPAIAIICGLITIVFALFAYLGKRKIEKDLTD